MSIQECVIKKRTRGLVWIGALSYRKMKITYESRKMLCPLCKHELEPHRYYGSHVFQLDSMKPDYKANFWSPLYENGELVWFSAPDLQNGGHDW